MQGEHMSRRSRAVGCLLLLLAVIASWALALGAAYLLFLFLARR